MGWGWGQHPWPPPLPSLLPFPPLPPSLPSLPPSPPPPPLSSLEMGKTDRLSLAITQPSPRFAAVLIPARAWAETSQPRACLWQQRPVPGGWQAPAPPGAPEPHCPGYSGVVRPGLQGQAAVGGQSSGEGLREQPQDDTWGIPLPGCCRVFHVETAYRTHSAPKFPGGVVHRWFMHAQRRRTGGDLWSRSPFEALGCPQGPPCWLGCGGVDRWGN